MLTVGKSQSGHDVLYFDGQNLSSDYNPKLECDKWMKYNSVEVNLMNYDHIVILGLGSGYLFDVLRNNKYINKLYFVDHNDLLVSHFKARPLNTPLQIYSFQSFLEIDPSPLATLYKVLDYTPYTSKFDNIYTEMKEFLLARNKDGWNWLMKKRGYHQIIDCGSLISIKDVDINSLQNSDLYFQSAILRELVR